MTTTKRTRRPAGKKAPAPYWWFSGASVTELARRIAAVGAATARLEVHLDGDTMTFVVKGEGVVAADIDPPINDSHRCPPQC